MTGRVLVYGATGYTGTLIAEHAADRGLDLAVGGRDPGRVRALAQRLDVPAVTLELDEPTRIAGALEQFDVVLNVAGPFRNTASPLMDAAIAARTHYLDTTAEFATFSLAASRDDAALRAGVMVMSGTGWDVVPTDSLAVYTASKVASPERLAIAIRITGGFSRGSLASAAGIEHGDALVRKAGRLVSAAGIPPRVFDVGAGDEEYLPASMGDLVTAHHSTGLGDIEVYLRTDSGFPDLDDNAAGPTSEERDEGRYHAVAEVVGRDGDTARARIDTPRGYAFTQLSSVEIARRAAAGETRPGFQSPASVYGHDLATTIGDTTITDL